MKLHTRPIGAEVETANEWNQLLNSWLFAIIKAFNIQKFLSDFFLIFGPSTCRFFIKWFFIRRKYNENYFISLNQGEHDRRYKEGSEQVFKAARVIMHPHYNSRTFDNDIALIKLNRPARLQNGVATVCLPNQWGSVQPGSTCYITGKMLVLCTSIFYLRGHVVQNVHKMFRSRPTI